MKLLQILFVLLSAVLLNALPSSLKQENNFRCLYVPGQQSQELSIQSNAAVHSLEKRGNDINLFYIINNRSIYKIHIDQFVYSVRVATVAILFGGKVTVHFFPHGTKAENMVSDRDSKIIAEFHGGFGGICLGGGISFGTVWLNYPLEHLNGWEMNFQANYVSVASNINFWGMQGKV